MSDRRFPLFVDLAGRRVVVVGGGPVGLRRAKALAEFGAEVTLISPRCGEAPPPQVRYLPRPYAPGDLEGAFLAVAATGSREINRQVGEEARMLGIPVSVADCEAECSFYFPAICVGEGLVAGVVSEGKDHHRTARAAKAIRKVLEELP